MSKLEITKQTECLVCNDKTSNALCDKCFNDGDEKLVMCRMPLCNEIADKIYDCDPFYDTCVEQVIIEDIYNDLEDANP